MKDRLKPLIIVTFLALCLLALPLVLIPLPYEGLDWLSYGAAIASYHGEPDSKSDKSEPQEPDAADPGEAKLVHDPDVPEITVWFPAEAVDQPVHLDVQPTSFSLLPDGTAVLENSIGTPILFGVWLDGQGRTVQRFNRSISINIPYNGDELTDATEEQLRLHIYNPAINGWVKLCSRIEVHEEVVTGLLSAPISYEGEDGPSLLAIAIDNTPPLEQLIDNLGVTTILVPDTDFSFAIQPGTVDVGTHFEVTRLPEVVADAAVNPLGNPVDIKACGVDHDELLESRQVTTFAKDIELSFGFNSAIARNAGGSNNLTIALLEDDDDWTDLRLLGLRPVADQTAVTIEIDSLGTFVLAAR